MTLTLNLEVFENDVAWRVQYQSAVERLGIDSRIPRQRAPFILGDLSSCRGLLEGLAFFPLNGHLSVVSHEGLLVISGELIVYDQEAHVIVLSVLDRLRCLLAGYMVIYPQTHFEFRVNYRLILSDDLGWVGD